LDEVLSGSGAGGESLVVPARVDVAALRARTDELPALLRGLAGPRARRAATSTRSVAGGDSLADRLAGMSDGECRRVLVDLVTTHVASVLGHSSPDAVGPDRAFKDLGFDSLASVELRNQLRGATGISLPATLVFDHPNSGAVADYLRAKLLPERQEQDRTDPEEKEIRQILGQIPLSRIRQAGLLDLLLELAGGDGEEPQSEQPATDIGSMEIDDLVRAALGQSGAQGQED